MAFSNWEVGQVTPISFPVSIIQRVVLLEIALQRASTSKRAFATIPRKAQTPIISRLFMHFPLTFWSILGSCDLVLRRASDGIRLLAWASTVANRFAWSKHRILY